MEIEWKQPLTFSLLQGDSDDGGRKTTHPNSDEESVILFHFQSLDLHSNPVNPIGKTVTDRAAYREMKQSYRDVLKKLQLWNVQYQLDLCSIGLCTTNWASVESSLPGNFDGLQNPALEWNSQPGFVFKCGHNPQVHLWSTRFWFYKQHFYKQQR